MPIGFWPPPRREHWEGHRNSDAYASSSGNWSYLIVLWAGRRSRVGNMWQDADTCSLLSLSLLLLILYCGCRGAVPLRPLAAERWIVLSSFMWWSATWGHMRGHRRGTRKQSIYVPRSWRGGPCIMQGHRGRPGAVASDRYPHFSSLWGENKQKPASPFSLRRQALPTVEVL